MLTYALAHGLAFSDREVVNTMLADLGDGGLTDLVRAGVLIEASGNKRIGTQDAFGAVLLCALP